MPYYKHLELITKSFIALGDLENSVKHGTKVARFLVAKTSREQVLKEQSVIRVLEFVKGLAMRKGEAKENESVRSSCVSARPTR
jgi:hypothetical protein